MRVRHDLTDGVLTITLDRPDKLNAMTDPMWSTLRDLLDTARGGEVRVVVVTGAGGAFCAGSDVGGLLGHPELLPERMRMSNACILALRELGVPTIASVDGVAAGAGANLALACDFVIASDRSRFLQLFIRRGLSLDSGASWLLPRLVGHRRALELALLGDEVAADEAQAWGLINRVVPAAELGEATTALAVRLASASPVALAGTKRLLEDAWQQTLAEALEAEIANQVAVIASPEADGAIRAFTK
ncbi:enoyl-CoA hydratase/isomerase family protein [Nocardioides sp. NPDC057577]|uniref:enoyl-CoA hydratase/isomerase family protein n=1 Tax=Nocardioides sp. NPDC057577 TaxID=3346171 RepID=UPI0036716B8E